MQEINELSSILIIFQKLISLQIILQLSARLHLSFKSYRAKFLFQFLLYIFGLSYLMSKMKKKLYRKVRMSCRYVFLYLLQNLGRLHLLFFFSSIIFQPCCCSRCLTPGIRNMKIFRTYLKVNLSMRTYASEWHQLGLPLGDRICRACVGKFCYEKKLKRKPAAPIVPRESSQRRLPDDSVFPSIGILNKIDIMIYLFECFIRSIAFGISCSVFSYCRI